MKLTFCGAARAVTGSCIHLQWQQTQLLIDCGLQLGQEVIDNNSFPFQPQQIDFVLLTHCHTDHCGRLPLLVKQGFSGPIFMTQPTARLLTMLLRESAQIQQHDAHWHNHKHGHTDQPLKQPLFTSEDVEKTLQRIQICAYEQPQQLQKELQFTFYDAGHILGSAMIALQYTEHHQPRTILFSGDIGNCNMPLIENPQQPPQAHTVVMESTHGDHCYLSQPSYKQSLAHLLEQTFQRGGNVIIPAAAVGRTQEILYYLHQIKQEQLVPTLPDFPVYVDSPQALALHQYYNSGVLDQYLDQQALTLQQTSGTLLDFPNLHFCITRQQSMALNHQTQPKVIIAAGGMCDSGPIRHHLTHNLHRPQCTVILLGSQRRGTLGSILLDNVSHVKLLGHTIPVQAQIVSLPVRPIHGDQPQLLRWLTQIQPPPQQIFLNHGDEEVCLLLAQALRQQNYIAQVPHYGETFTI